MSNHKRLPLKNRHALQGFLKSLKGNRVLESAQLEAVERIEKHFDAFLHALDTSNSRDAKLRLAIIAKEVCNVFLVDGNVDRA